MSNKPFDAEKVALHLALNIAEIITERPWADAEPAILARLEKFRRAAYEAGLKNRTKVHEALEEVCGGVDESTLVHRLVEVQGYLRHGITHDEQYQEGLRVGRREMAEEAARLCDDADRQDDIDSGFAATRAAHGLGDRIRKLAAKGTGA